MEQRRLRLGDILDDYCPRERRVTNHAVVAMVEETVKQTRCTTCDAEHPYKGGQAPRRRKKEEGPSALFKEVLAGKPDTDVPPTIDTPEVFAADATDEGDSADGDVNGNVMSASEARAHSISSRQAPPIRREPAPESPSPVARATTHQAAVPASAVASDDAIGIAEDPDDRETPANDDQRVPDVEDGPVHRQLIRATLPRIEGQKEERRPTDFTIRQPGGRGNNPGNQFRGGGGGDRTRSGGRGGHGGNPGNAGHGGNAGHRGNGHRPQGGPRFAGARSGQGSGQGQGQGGRGQGGGFRPAQQPRHGGGRKRSR
jgi:hypothetical protein